MKIKDLQQFRQTWKQEQGYPDEGWDADFLGATHGSTNGFYKMVNGIVNDIKADLVPKLQNAQDEQAIYEFLQNAADADAQDCVVLYDEEFFMVLNNGQPFRNKDIKAILNAFQGTKADKTRPENCNKIGRYGIGFKLAHRLVGKSDGADELIRDLAGPILFSWHNEAQFNALSGRTPESPLESVFDAQTPALGSWLLKIVLSCFPVMPGESVKDLNYEPRTVFQETELQELTSFLQRHEADLADMDLSQGALFFLRFGPKKHDKLESSILNLKSGIGYSLNTLKHLDRVVLKDERIEAYDIEFESFELQPSQPEFEQIDPEFPFCPIQIKVGFHTEPKEAIQLKQAPTLYQYFPMRNERHGLAFLVHATSFAKVTDRTRLDDKGEANFETFNYLVGALEERMGELQNDQFERFTLLFQSILLSDRPEKGDIVHTELYDPLMDYIRVNIPTQKGNCYPADVVVLKQTDLPVEPIHFGIGKEWFYWSDDKANRLLRDEASKVKKLNLKAWTLGDLLREGNPDLITRWIKKLNATNYATFVNELKDAAADPAIRSLLADLPCFRFSDPAGKVKFYTLDELREQANTFLIGERTKSIRSIIKALGFSILEFDLDIFSTILGQDKSLQYLFNDIALLDRLSSKTANNQLSSQQRNQLWDFIQQLDGIKADQLKQLALFPDQTGQVKPFLALLPPTQKGFQWANAFTIDEVTNPETVTALLTPSDRLYSNFLRPYWEYLIQHPDIQADFFSFYQDVLDAFQRDKRKTPLTDVPWVIVDPGALPLSEEQIWFHRNLEVFDDYALADELLGQTIGLRLPHPDMLAFLNQGPFKIRTIQSRPEWRSIQQQFTQAGSFEEAPFSRRKALFQFLMQSGLPAAMLKQFPLFQNANGQLVPPGQLLPSGASHPDWLAPRAIDPDEQDDQWLDLLIAADRIYPDLLLKNWDDLVQDQLVLNDPGAFYEGVKQQFEQSKTATKLVQQAYVYTDELGGFLDRKSVYFHPALAEQEDYPALRQAVQLLSGLKLPDAFILPYLTEDPFKMVPGRFIPLVKTSNTELRDNEVRAIIRLLDAIGESFFKHFVVTEGTNKGLFLIEKKGRNIQIYLGSKRSKNYQQLANHLPEGYKIIPAEFYDEANQPGTILAGEKLFKELLKKVDAEVLGDLVETGQSAPELQKEFIQQLQEVVFEEGQVYDKDSIPSKMVQLFRKRDSNPEALRKKIKLQDQDRQRWTLSDYAFPDWLSMKGA
ncbi:MAG: ATP-binding protein, partial [Bacteroidota bacterium]